MLRASAKSLGKWTIAAVLVSAMVAFAIPAAVGGHAAVAAPGSATSAGGFHSGALAAPASPVRAFVHPLAGPTASATITSTYTGKQTIPVEVDWTISVGNTTLDPTNVTMGLLITNGANEIANWTQDVVTAQTSYSAFVDYGVLTSENFNGGDLPTSAYTFTVWVWATNVSDPNATGTWANSAPVAATLAVANVLDLFTTTLPLYDAMPFWLNWTVSVTGNTGTTVDANNVSLALEFRLVIAGCNSVFGFGGACPTIANDSVAFDAGGSYALAIDESVMAQDGYANGALPPGNYQVIVWTTLANSSDPNQEPRTTAAAQYIYPVFDQNSATFLAPDPVSPVSAGNVTIAVQYVADYLSGANVTVFASDQTTVVFAGGVFQPAVSRHAASTTWAGATPGQYYLVLDVLTAAGAAGGATSFSEWFNVTSAGGGGGGGGGVVYYNTTNWVNTTTPTGGNIGGLSPGVLAAVLLVAGLIIGMIVAMALGRMMWGSAKPASPQPWQSKPGMNECSVCHQSFATEAELKDHQKQAHGM